MDLAPLLCVIRATKGPLLFLIRGLLIVISTVFAVSPIGHIDLPIILLFLWGSLAVDSRNRARASDALMQVFATASRLATVLGFFMVIYYTVLMSLSSSRKVLTISMS
jgi:hypothetical protein